MAPKAQSTSVKSAPSPKKAAKTAAVAAAAIVATAPNPDLDEDADEDEEGGASASGGGAGGMTPAIQREEPTTPMTTKNFRNHPDMENFFRFIYENDLRLEALDIVDDIIATRQNKKKLKLPSA